MDVLISVIIPIYNVEAYLERCLDSVINNTYQNLEIICVNDGSPDNCHKILERYAAQDNRIKVIWQEKQGVSVARNTGMDVATGDYIYFLDADDWIHRESFLFLLQTATETNADMIAGGYQKVYCENEWNLMEKICYPDRVEVMTIGEAREKAKRAMALVVGTLYSRSLIAQHRFPKGLEYAEDSYFHVMMIHDDLMYAYVDLPLYCYYNRHSSAMQTLTLDKQMKSIRYWVEHLHEFKKPEYAVSWISQQVFYYNLYGKYCKNPEVARRNAQIVRKQCLPYLWDCRKLCGKFKVKMVMNIFFPSLYNAIIKYRDPTWSIYEDGLRKRNENVMLIEWEKL